MVTKSDYFQKPMLAFCPNYVAMLKSDEYISSAFYLLHRTSNGCGWGVKAMENIKRGTFVVEYVGEIITNEEAERRGEVSLNVTQ